MSKIKIKTSLENVSENEINKVEVIGLKIDNKIKFIDDNTITTITINKEKIIIFRISEESALEMAFNKILTTTGIYDIKSVNMKFNMKIKTHQLDIKDGYICINYDMSLEDNSYINYKYKIEYEVIE